MDSIGAIHNIKQYIWFDKAKSYRFNTYVVFSWAKLSQIMRITAYAVKICTKFRMCHFSGMMSSFLP